MVNLDQSSAAATAPSNQAASSGPTGSNNTRTQNGHCGPRIPTLSLHRREDIILRYMNITRMRREYAVRCLEENNFNLDVALDVFNQLKEANALPDDLFFS